MPHGAFEQLMAKEERIQRGQELFMYIARQYNGASLQQIVRWLEVRDVSTSGHGIGKLLHSHIQA
jgi:chromosomal replication initiation ATPase DnaA